MVSLVNHIVYAKMFKTQESSVEAKKLKCINYSENVCWIHSWTMVDKNQWNTFTNINKIL
jgi:hypothetical protein